MTLLHQWSYTPPPALTESRRDGGQSRQPHGSSVCAPDPGVQGPRRISGARMQAPSGEGGAGSQQRSRLSSAKAPHYCTALSTSRAASGANSSSISGVPKESKQCRTPVTWKKGARLFHSAACLGLYQLHFLAARSLCCQHLSWRRRVFISRGKDGVTCERRADHRIL